MWVFFIVGIFVIIIRVRSTRVRGEVKGVHFELMWAVCCVFTYCFFSTKTLLRSWVMINLVPRKMSRDSRRLLRFVFLLSKWLYLRRRKGTWRGYVYGTKSRTSGYGSYTYDGRLYTYSIVSFFMPPKDLASFSYIYPTRNPLLMIKYKLSTSCRWHFLSWVLYSYTRSAIFIHSFILFAQQRLKQ